MNVGRTEGGSNTLGRMLDEVFTRQRSLGESALLHSLGESSLLVFFGSGYCEIITNLDMQGSLPVVKTSRLFSGRALAAVWTTQRSAHPRNRPFFGLKQQEVSYLWIQ